MDGAGEGVEFYGCDIYGRIDGRYLCCADGFQSVGRQRYHLGHLTHGGRWKVKITRRSLLGGTAASLLVSPAAKAWSHGGGSGALAVSTNGRYLVNSATGTPFLMMADTAFS